MKIFGIRNDYAQNEVRRREDGMGACSYYRIAKPLECLTNHQVRVVGREFETIGTSEATKMQEIFSNNDVIFSQYSPNQKMNAWLFSMRDHFRRKIVLDMDDSYLNVPPHNSQYEKFKAGTAERANFTAAMSLCDAITVSTEPLKREMEQHLKKLYGFTPPIFVIPNMNDVNDWAFSPIPEDDVITIGYMGSTSHKEDLKFILPVLGDIVKKYPKTKVSIIGMLETAEVREMFNTWDESTLKQATIFRGSATFTEFRKNLAQFPLDIGIAPLIDSPFNRDKSHIKWMEYSMYEIPVIASKTYPYYFDILGRKTIQHNETGILVKNKPADWFNAIERLIHDRPLRKRLGANAKKDITLNWQYKNSEIADIWEKILLTIRQK